jgi:hypothetical protein
VCVGCSIERRTFRFASRRIGEAQNRATNLLDQSRPPLHSRADRRGLSKAYRRAADRNAYYLIGQTYRRAADRCACSAKVSEVSECGQGSAVDD